MRLFRLFLLLACVTLFPICQAGNVWASSEEGKASSHGDGEKAASKSEDSSEGESHGGEGGGKKGDKEKDTSISGGKFAGDPIYVHLPQLLLPVIDDYGSQQIVNMMIDARVATMDDADTVRTNFPRVQDSIIQALYGGFSDGSLRIGNGPALNIPKVKDKVLETLRHLFGDKAIEGVLIQGLTQRPF